MVCKNLKDNYSSSLKSISKTISPFLIKLTMTHMIKFVSSAASIFITWDVIWILVTSTFFSNLHMVREYIYIYKPVRWQGSSVDGRAPTIDNSTNATIVLPFKNLFDLEWTTKDKQGYHLLLLPPNQRIGSLTGRASYKHHAYTRLGYLAQSINYSRLSALWTRTHK
jgi:hypothetical protein